MILAARLSAGITGPLASAASAIGVLVFVVGTLRALRDPSTVAVRFAATLGLTLEFFLAAGLLRLADEQSLLALAGVAAIVVLRKIAGYGVKLASSAVSP